MRGWVFPHYLKMRPYHRVHVELSKREKQRLGEMLRKGRQSARVLRRAFVLQQLDRGQTAAEVGLNLSLSSKPWGSRKSGHRE